MAGLVKELDKVAKKNKNSFNYVVYLKDDVDAAKKTLVAFAKTNKLAAVDMTINMGGSKSPKGYKLNPDVKHTILMARGNKVVANFALDKIDPATTKKVVAAATKLLTSKAEKADKRGGKKKDKKEKRRRKKKDKDKDTV